VFRVSGLNFSAAGSHCEVAIIGVVAYGGGLYLNNYLMWSEDTAPAASFRVQEPVVCILLLFLAARIPTEHNRVCAVVCFCLGAALLTTKFTVIPDVKSLLYIIASVFVVSRNMVIKHLYDSSVSFSLRHQTTLHYVGIGGALSCILIAVAVSTQLLVASIMAMVAGVVSVTLLYVLFTMLSLYDTLTVAVFMLWAHVLENVIFVVNNTRPSFLFIVFGAVLFAAGHYFYFKDGLENSTVHLNLKQGENKPCL
jgi:hypothetical protein